MNRYVIQGLISDLKIGKRIVLISHTRHSARDLFMQVVESLGEFDGKVRRANGGEHILYGSSGGILDVLSANPDALRGRTLDVLALANDREIGVQKTLEILKQARIAGSSSRFGLEIERL